MVDFKVAKADFAKNPERRCACVLVLDTSGSMSEDDAIDQLNRALAEDFQKDLNNDPVAKKRLEIAIVTFGGDVRVMQDFVTADKFVPPRLEADGPTLMAPAVCKAIEMVGARKAQYQKFGIEYYRPWIFLLTDGYPTDESGRKLLDKQGEEWLQTVEAVHAGEKNKRFNFFAVGMGDGFDELAASYLVELSVRKPLKLREANFKDMFLWLSASLSTVGNSAVDEKVPLKQPNWDEELSWGAV